MRHRQTLRLLSPLPHRLVDEMPLQGAAGRPTAAHPGDRTAGLFRKRRRDHQGRAFEGSRPYVRVCPAEAGDQRPRTQDQGPVVTENPAGQADTDRPQPGNRRSNWSGSTMQGHDCPVHAFTPYSFLTGESSRQPNGEDFSAACEIVA